MRRLLSSGAVAAILLTVPVGAEAGITVGFRAGLGIVGGELEHRDSTPVYIDDYAWRGVSFLLQAGATFARNRATVEGFGEVRDVVLGRDVETDCDVLGRDCDMTGLRVGVLGTYRFTPERLATPWVGAALALETLTVTANDPSLGETDRRYRGYNVEVMGGADFRLGRVFALGPYASIQVGRFTHVGGDFDYDPEADVHSWLQLGVHGRFDF